MKNQTTISQNRNYGIDLLKITAMFLIVCWHLIYHGNALQFTDTRISSLLQSFFILGVNSFALTSGYVLSDIKYKPHRIVVHWLQVVVLCIIITSYFLIFSQNVVWKEDLIYCFMPLTKDKYWYFSAYFILYLFIPFYNILLNNLSKKQSYLLVILLIIIFSLFNFKFLGRYFSVSGGYNTLWLSVLYIIGAVIKKHFCVQKLKIKFLLLAFFIAVSTTFLSSIIQYEYKILKIGSFDNDNITILLSSIFLMLIFLKINIRNSIIAKIITKISTLTFGVYLIHDNYFIRIQFILNRFAWLGELSPVMNILELLGIALVIFVTCLMIDYVRAFLFEVFKVNFLCEKLCGFFVRKIRLLSDKFFEN